MSHESHVYIVKEFSSKSAVATVQKLMDTYCKNYEESWYCLISSYCVETHVMRLLDGRTIYGKGSKYYPTNSEELHTFILNMLKTNGYDCEKLEDFNYPEFGEYPALEGITKINKSNKDNDLTYIIIINVRS